MLQEARGRLLRGWSRGAQARDARGRVVLPWNDDAASWSLLGALLAAWNRQDGQEEADFVAHRVDALGLGEATRVLTEATGTSALDRWNDADGRNHTEVLGAVDRALAVLDGRY
jgi:hypothetical protein